MLPGFFAITAFESFCLQHCGNNFDHFAGLPQRKNIGVFRVKLHAGVFFQRVLFQNRLNPPNASEKMLILVGPRDARDVGEVRPQTGQGFEFASIAKIPTVTRAVQDDEFALGLGYQNRPQHGNVRCEAGASGDEHGGFAGRRPVERVKTPLAFGPRKTLLPCFNSNKRGVSPPLVMSVM